MQKCKLNSTHKEKIMCLISAFRMRVPAMVFEANMFNTCCFNYSVIKCTHTHIHICNELIINGILKHPINHSNLFNTSLATPLEFPSHNHLLRR